MTELFLNLESLRELVFGLIFTLIAFWIGRESANKLKREKQRSFLRQLIALQTAISNLANKDEFWKSSVDKSQADTIFSPLMLLMNSINAAAGDADIAADIPDLKNSIHAYESSFNEFIAAWSDYERRAKGYKQRNDEVLDALIAITRQFDWRVRWGLVQPLQKMKLVDKKPGIVNLLRY